MLLQILGDFTEFFSSKLIFKKEIVIWFHEIFFLQIGSETEIGDYLQQVVMMTIWTMMMPWCLLWKNIGKITFHFHEKTNHTILIFKFTNFFRPSAYDIGRPKEDDDINNIRDYYTNMMTRQRAINRYGMLISREKKNY